MEYLDFSSVINIFRKYISDDRTVIDSHTKKEVKVDQVTLMELIFATFKDDESALDFAFDNGQVCRWINGQVKITPRIISFNAYRLNSAHHKM